MAPPDDSDRELYLPMSALRHLGYCERSAMLVLGDGVWRDNAHTAAGHAAHTRIDAGEKTTKPGFAVHRSLAIVSDRLRVTGKADCVELTFPSSGEGGKPSAVVPVETKLGARPKATHRRGDELQLCAQAMALEEMLGVAVIEGVIFHVKTARRRRVMIDEALRARTIAAAARLHDLFERGELPRPVFDNRCDGCSLRSACLPEVSLGPGELRRRLSLSLHANEVVVQDGSEGR